MITGRVIGEITATIRHPFFEGKRMLVVARTGADGAETGDYVIALDAVGVGPGDPVLVLDEGTGARQVVGSATAPVRTVVVGFLDRVDLARRGRGAASSAGRPTPASLPSPGSVSPV